MLVPLLHFCILKMYLLSCVHFRSFHAVTLLGQALNVTKAAEVAMAPIAKAFPTFSGALIVADALSNFGEFSVLIYFFHFGIFHLFDGRLWTGSFHLKQWRGGGGGGTDSIEQASISQYYLNVHICTENE